MAKARATKERSLTAADLRAMLRVRFAPPTWALFEEVHNGTGGARSRSADAVAMSLWPSRGLEVHGFEIKVSRRDWLAERDRPEKADAVGKYCDRWWLVIAADDVIRPQEIPPAWGVLVARGKRLAEATEAARLQPEPLDRSFVAAMLRRAQDQLKDSIPRLDIESQIIAARAQGYDAGRAAADNGPRLQALEDAVRDFEAASGIKITAYHGQHLGERFAAFVARGSRIRLHRNTLEMIALRAAAMQKSAAEQIAAIDENGID